MIAEARSVAGVIIVDAERGPAGFGPMHDVMLDGRSVLQRVVDRVRRCGRVDDVIVVHARAHQPPPVMGARLHATDRPVASPGRRRIIAARKWSPTAWRGGIAGMTVHDENLAADAALDAMQAAGAESALLVGPDWPLVDPALCDAVIERHLQSPDQMRMTFTQAPPGLCGIAIARSLLEELAAGGGTIGATLDYNPRLPQADPIGRDVCVQIDPAVRAAAVRAVYDMPRWRAAIDRLAGGGADLLDVAAADVVAKLQPDRSLPQQVMLELTPRRRTSGPMTPGHYATINRGDMAPGLADELLAQLGTAGDAAVTFGGVGDALEHLQWHSLVDAARAAGVWGLHLETDLLDETLDLAAIADADLDVLSVRLHADQASTYTRLMGVDAFGPVLDRIEWLLNHRVAMGLAWVVPRMIKTRDNVGELESFVDRWTFCAGHALVEGPPAGASAGAMASLAVLDMAPPRRRACRQLARRMTIHSDGRAALCDQDWTGEHAVADLRKMSIADAWARLSELHAQQAAGRMRSPCDACRAWHRP